VTTPDRAPAGTTPDAIRRSRRSNRRDEAGVVAVLVAIWLLLWGEVSVANIASGVLVGVLLLVSFPADHDVVAVRHRFRPFAAASLVAFVVGDLVRSTVGTALEVLRTESTVRTGVIACPLRVQNDGLVTFLANVIALSPGTMPIEVAYRPHVIYVHSLHATDPEQVRMFVSKLEELAVRVIGGPEAVAAVQEPAPWPPPAPAAQPTVERRP
jgi:multicomponent Na+:H+ antiporter subunit E